MKKIIIITIIIITIIEIIVILFAGYLLAIPVAFLQGYYVGTMLINEQLVMSKHRIRELDIEIFRHKIKADEQIEKLRHKTMELKLEISRLEYQLAKERNNEI